MARELRAVEIEVDGENFGLYADYYKEDIYYLGANCILIDDKMYKFKNMNELVNLISTKCTYIGAPEEEEIMTYIYELREDDKGEYHLSRIKENKFKKKFLDWNLLKIYKIAYKGRCTESTFETEEQFKELIYNVTGTYELFMTKEVKELLEV